MLEFFIKGALVSGGLIVAIGSQNAFVLRQGLLKKNIFYICLLCFSCDVILMGIGVLGLGSYLSASPVLTNILAIGGALFLLYYAYNAFISSYKGISSLDLSNVNTANKEKQLLKVLLSTLAVTLLNPQVYFDTIVMVGGVAGTFSYDQKIYFLIGALVSSFVWFFSLGYGSRILIPLFTKPLTWRIFDFFIGCIMLFIAISLINHVR